VLDRSVPYHLDDRRTPPIIQSPTEKINPARRRSARTPSHKTCLLPGKVRLARGRHRIKVQAGLMMHPFWK
jgi:hypothetical protein